MEGMHCGNYKIISAVVILMALLWLPIQAEPSAELLDRMNSDEFEERSKAYKELKAWAQQNLRSSPDDLHKVWSSSKHPEVKTRCYEVMKEVAIQRRFGKGRGFIGIRMEETAIKLKEHKELRAGVAITMVMPNTPAQKFGLKMGDVIIGVDELDFGKSKVAVQPQQQMRFGRIQIDFGTVNRFGDYIKSKQPDEEVTLRIMRNGKAMNVKVTLMKRPASADLDPFGRQIDVLEDEKDRFFKDWLKSKAAN